MEDRETPRIRKYRESKTTRIMFTTVPHFTSGWGRFFFFDRVYICSFLCIKDVSFVSVLRDKPKWLHAHWKTGTCPRYWTYSDLLARKPATSRLKSYQYFGYHKWHFYDTKVPSNAVMDQTIKAFLPAWTDKIFVRDIA